MAAAAGIVAGLLVALRQIAPDDEVDLALARCFGLRNCHLCQARPPSPPNPVTL